LRSRVRKRCQFETTQSCNQRWAPTVRSLPFGSLPHGLRPRFRRHFNPPQGDIMDFAPLSKGGLPKAVPCRKPKTIGGNREPAMHCPRSGRRLRRSLHSACSSDGYTGPTYLGAVTLAKRISRAPDRLALEGVPRPRCGLQRTAPSTSARILSKVLQFFAPSICLNSMARSFASSRSRSASERWRTCCANLRLGSHSMSTLMATERPFSSTFVD
jgi:hypothetical protein